MTHPEGDAGTGPGGDAGTGPGRRPRRPRPRRVRGPVVIAYYALAATERAVDAARAWSRVAVGVARLAASLARNRP